MGDRDGAVRERMRREWGARARFYAEQSGEWNRAYAESLVAKVAPGVGARVLDVATGPGTVALVAARAVGPTGRVVATDLAPEWGEMVAAAAADAGLGNIEFREMGAEGLDLPDEGFDAAFCQFGLMFVPNPVRALREMRRVLRPGRRLGVAVWSTPEKVAHFLAMRTIMAAAAPMPASERAPAPWGLGEPGLIEGHVAEAGFREIVVARETRERVVDDPEVEWQRRLDDPSGIAARVVGGMSGEERGRLHDRVIGALEGYRRDGAIRLASEAVLVTAVR